jgi:hypothetical protein
MLSTIEVVMNSFVVLLLPLAVHSMISGSLPPPTTWLGRLYASDPRLQLVSNLFLLALCISSMVRLALHFGLVDKGLQAMLEFAAGVPFFVLLVLFLVMLARAGLKLRRATNHDA